MKWFCVKFNFPNEEEKEFFDSITLRRAAPWVVAVVTFVITSRFNIMKKDAYLLSKYLCVVTDNTIVTSMTSIYQFITRVQHDLLHGLQGGGG